MLRPAILDAFASHRFLDRLDNSCLMDLASAATPFRLSPGQYLARQGQSATAFYLIQSGTVKAGVERDNGDWCPFMTVGPGGALGWSWLVPPYRWQYTCRADTAVHGLKFDAEWLRVRCESNHELGYHFLKELISSLAAQFATTCEETHSPHAAEPV